MAKAIGLVGTLSGKSGNFVFCKGANGRTIVRPYQPQVYNPKTNAQSLQRSKMVLAGNLSALASSALLMSMNMGRKVANRAAFVKNILRKADADLESGSYVASIIGQDVVFGKGSVPARFGSESYVEANNGNFNFRLSPIGVSDDMIGKIGYRCIVVVARKQGSQTFESISYVDAMVSSKTEPLGVSVPIPNAVLGEHYVGGYVVPFELTEEAASQFGSDSYFSGTASALTAVLSSTPSVVKDWGDSRMIDDFFEYTGE